MKKLFFVIAVAAMSLAASAQTTRTIKGAVIDKNGNPLPGATVEAAGGSEVTTVDADGTFTMEVPIWLKKATARYAGMRNNTMKVQATDMIFTMKNGQKKQLYLIANYGHSFRDYSSSNTGGLMFGALNKWGWYVKANAGSMSGTEYYHGYYSDYEDDVDGIEANVTAGVSKRIIKPLHAYVGFGFGNIHYEFSNYSGHHIDSGFGFLPEIGLIGHFFNHVVVNFSYSPNVTIDANLYHSIQVGVGYAF